MHCTRTMVDFSWKFHLICWIIWRVNGETWKIHPETYLTLEEKVLRNGYPIETHRIVTEDGYILSAYRIPFGLNLDSQKGNRSALLIIHGMGGSPHAFLALGKGRAPAYYFADRGLDVWLFSGRGLAGAFKENHQTLDWNKDDEYWSFSMHELGVYDTAATIDYIINHTGQQKVSTIGHSSGGFDVFCLLADRPNYNSKVKVAINWGSTPILRHMQFPLAQLAVEARYLIRGLWNFLGIVEAIPSHDIVAPLVRTACAHPLFQKMCEIVTWVIGTHRSYLQNPQDVPILAANMVRVSINQPLHFLDNIANGTFRKFDHGPTKNMKIYGRSHPPLYNLTAVTAPVAFYWGANDEFATKKDLHESIRLLPNVIVLYDIPFAKFNHLDFVSGRNSAELVYEPIVELIKDLDRGFIFAPIKLTSNNTERGQGLK